MEKVTLRKIQLADFIEMLISIYNEGADYIDIVGCSDKHQDTVSIEVRKEYFCKEEDFSEGGMNNSIIA